MELDKETTVNFLKTLYTVMYNVYTTHQSKYRKVNDEMLALSKGGMFPFSYSIDTENPLRVIHYIKILILFFEKENCPEFIELINWSEHRSLSLDFFCSNGHTHYKYADGEKYEGPQE